MKSNLTKSAEIRARLSHPIIDSDGHTVRAKTDVNPDFFKGTRVQEAIASALKVNRKDA